MCSVEIINIDHLTGDLSSMYGCWFNSSLDVNVYGEYTKINQLHLPQRRAVFEPFGGFVGYEGFFDMEHRKKNPKSAKIKYPRNNAKVPEFWENSTQTKLGGRFWACDFIMQNILVRKIVSSWYNKSLGYL